MIRSLTDLHGEFTHSQHATVRTMIDSVGAESQVTRGLDNKACASYKRAQHYCEDARDTAVMWLDRVPGELNAADLLTKRVKCEKDLIQDSYLVSASRRDRVPSSSPLVNIHFSKYPDFPLPSSFTLPATLTHGATTKQPDGAPSHARFHHQSNRCSGSGGVSSALRCGRLHARIRPRYAYSPCSALRGVPRLQSHSSVALS